MMAITIVRPKILLVVVKRAGKNPLTVTKADSPARLDDYWLKWVDAFTIFNFVFMNSVEGKSTHVTLAKGVKRAIRRPTEGYRYGHVKDIIFEMLIAPETRALVERMCQQQQYLYEQFKLDWEPVIVAQQIQ